MKTVLFLLLLPFSSPVQHSLRHSGAGFSRVPGLPGFIGNIDLDGMVLAYCDSNKHIWINTRFSEKMTAVDPKFLKNTKEECFEVWPNFFKIAMDILKQLNINKDPIVLQGVFGCEWDDETVDVPVTLARTGYNGEDFMKLDLKTLTHIVQNPQANILKTEWDTYVAELKLLQDFWNICPDLLKYLTSDSLLRPANRPSVSLLQKSPSSPVRCHATGFYPNRALMFWRKDGEEIHENVEHGDILPNHDGTFQMSVDLNVSSVAPAEWRRYDCVFQLSDVENIKTILDKKLVRTNWVSPKGFLFGVIGGVIVLLLLLCITGFIWKRFRPEKTSESSEGRSDVGD